MAGRKSKLTEKTQARICELVAAGHYLKVAAKAAGIDETTLHDWRARGREAKSGKFFDFHQAVEQAEAESEETLLRTVLIFGGAKGALEVLKRRFPERWGDRHRMEHSTPDGPMEHQHSGPDGGPAMAVLIADGGTWDHATHGGVQVATEDDLPDTGETV